MGACGEAGTPYHEVVKEVRESTLAVVERTIITLKR